MVGRNMFKTRICILYRKGRCHRQSCSFAHGDAELRHYNNNNNNNSSSFNARRDYRAADLRDKLGRQWSPPRRNSLERDARDPHPSPRFGKRSDWSHRKRQHFDGENDHSGSLRISDGVERQARDRKPLSPEFDNIHDEQLKQLQSEIDMLEDHKQQLQIYLEESSQEAESLNSKIEELEMQVSAEKEECKRVSSKIRKFVKANNRHIRIQEELKRSQVRLQRLGDQLGSDARPSANEDDINVSILSDEELMGDHLTSPKVYKASPRKNEMIANVMVSRKDQYHASPSKKRMRAHMGEADERPKQGEWVSFGNMRSERHSRWDPHLAETKITGELKTENNNTSSAMPIRRNSNFNGTPLGKKYKDLKSTRMVASAVDEVVEVDEFNEKLEAKETSTRVEGGSTTHNSTALPPPPPPPPPPIAPNAYLQYKGDNEALDAVNGDGDDVDEDEMLDVDIV